jgi:hypothetical protein
MLTARAAARYVKADAVQVRKEMIQAKAHPIPRLLEPGQRCSPADYDAAVPRARSRSSAASMVARVVLRICRRPSKAATGNARNPCLRLAVASRGTALQLCHRMVILQGQLSGWNSPGTSYPPCGAEVCEREEEARNRCLGGGGPRQRRPG